MPDVFDVLGKDHKEVKQLLARLEKERPGRNAGKTEFADRKKQAGTLIAEESRHEAAEEKVFWPAVRDKLPEGDKLASHATSQENEAKKIMAKLGKLDPGNPEFEDLLTQFVKDGREHIDFEETQVWPLMRKALSKQEASEMGKQIQEAKKTAPATPKPGQIPAQGRRRMAEPERTRAELYDEARRLGVQGRSSMNKEELARHVAQHH